MEKNTTIEFYFKSRWVSYIFITIAALNVALLLTSAAGNCYWSISPWWLQVIFSLFDLSQENNVAVWYSSMLLFTAGMLAVFCFLVDWSHQSTKSSRILASGWLFCSLVFFALSFDEIGSIHEQIGDYAFMKNSGEVIVGGILPGWKLFDWSIWIFGGLITLFGVLKLKKQPYSLAIFVFGVLCYLSNPVQENFEINAHMAAADPLHWERPTLFLILEEGSEIFGSSAFIIAMSLYISRSLKKNSDNQGSSYNQSEGQLSGRLLQQIAVAFLMVIPAGYLATFLIFGNVQGSEQTGVPVNWYPSMICLLLSLYFLYTLISRHSARKSATASYLILFCSMIFFSALIGSNSQHGLPAHKKLALFTAILIALAFASIAFLARDLSATILRSHFVKSGVIACAMLITGSIFITPRFGDLGLFMFSYVTLASLTFVYLNNKKKRDLHLLT